MNIKTVKMISWAPTWRRNHRQNRSFPKQSFHVLPIHSTRIMQWTLPLWNYMLDVGRLAAFSKCLRIRILMLIIGLGKWGWGSSNGGSPAKPSLASARGYSQPCKAKPLSSSNSPAASELDGVAGQGHHQSMEALWKAGGHIHSNTWPNLHHAREVFTKETERY